MSNFAQRILNALGGGPWRLMLEKRDSTFILTAFRGKNSVPFSSIMNHYPLTRQLSAVLPLKGNTLVVPLHSLVQVRHVLHELGSESLRVDVSPEVEAFQVSGVPPRFAVSYVWSETTRCIERQMSMDAAYCGSGWFLSGNSGWYVAGLDVTDDAWLSRAAISGQDIIELLKDLVPSWQGRGLPIQCNLRYSHEPVMTLTIRYVCDDYLDCAVTWSAPASGIGEIPSLPSCVLVNGIVRPGLSPKALGKYVPTDSGAFRIRGQQIPLFLRDIWSHIQPWTTGAVAVLQEQHHILTGDGTLNLVVKPADQPGMRIVLASPVFSCDGVSQSAELLSRRLGVQTEFVRLPYAWVPAQVVRQAGIGPLGRLSDGTLLKCIPLTAVEVLQRGSRRLEGPWARVDFPALVLPDSRSPFEAAQMHLDFLYSWCIPGGLVGNLSAYQQVFLAWLMSLISRYAGFRILVVVSKKDLDSLDDAWVQSATVRFEGNRRDPQPTPMYAGLVLATPKAIETISELEKTRWDLLCLLAADELIKTSRSSFYRHLGRCQCALTVGLFSGHDFLKRTQAREALSQAFGIPLGEDGGLLWRYGLRDPREQAPHLPPPYQFQGRRQSPQATTRPAELTIGSQPKATGAVPIPARLPAVVSASIPGRQPFAIDGTGIHVEVRYSTSDDPFLVAARNAVNRGAARARFVPFQCYWPTYSSMTREQQQWYFYWRAQVRAGHYPDTDLSYIFVHIYELINNVGVRNADEGYECLCQIWRNYRDRFPRLDGYLIDWIADYAAVYRPKVSPFAIYAEALAMNATVGIVDLVLPGYLNRPLNQLPVSVIEALSKYQVRRSKFYNEGHRDLVEKGIPAAINSVDNHMCQRFGNGIFDLFNPGTTVPIQRQAFQSARYAGNARNLTLGTVVPFSRHPPLKDFMTAVVKHAENTLRKQTGYKSKLSGYTLEPEIQSVIEECLGLTRSAEVVPLARRQVDIDLARVQALISESDQVRDMLLESSQSSELGPVATPITAAPESDTPVRPIGTPTGLLTDLQPVHATLTRLSTSETSILAAIIGAGGEMSAAALGHALPDVLLEASIDVINNLALANLGDVLIAEEAGAKILTDDYRDELEYLLLHNRDIGVTSSLLDGASQLPTEWSAFSRRLTDPQLAVLEVIIGQNDVSSTIRLIAEANATMPGALLDSINQLAMDTIGDVILDTAVDPPMAEDEDMDMVRQLLAEAAVHPQ